MLELSYAILNYAIPYSAMLYYLMGEGGYKPESCENEVTVRDSGFMGFRDFGV